MNTVPVSTTPTDQRIRSVERQQQAQRDHRPPRQHPRDVQQVLGGHRHHVAELLQEPGGDAHDQDHDEGGRGGVRDRDEEGPQGVGTGEYPDVVVEGDRVQSQGPAAASVPFRKEKSTTTTTGIA